MHYFVSDLHLFSDRSDAHRYDDRLKKTVRDAKTFVLGGDIFDFDWTTLPSVDHTVDAAMDWLGELLSENNDCQFHYLLGNHDCHLPFVNRLQQLSTEVDNLKWDPFYIRLGNSLMMHGDVDNKSANNQSIEKSRTVRMNATKRHALQHRLYDLAIKTRLHKVIGHVANPKKRVASRILGYLENEGQGVESGLENVYFGHTHVVMREYQYQGIHFHNGGAPMPGLKFRIMEMDIDGC
ncbi:MAG: hypothetical protein COA78_14215 [Blastopirellula sp.]|nr:MAG: hypothetical protein COA78_14215 [Blastopirellula sp.]